ncbi:MAG TPA: copper-binding protein [bacterium]|nr:copper-binding protein [bacterium]
MNNAPVRLPALALGLLSLLPACSQPQSAAAGPGQAPTPSSAEAQAQAKTYQGHGVIRGFQSDGKVVVLEHQAIPGLMEGMTMGFELADPAAARGFKLGDRVDFNLSVQGDNWTIESMKKSQ